MYKYTFHTYLTLQTNNIRYFRVVETTKKPAIVRAECLQSRLSQSSRLNTRLTSL